MAFSEAPYFQTTSRDFVNSQEMGDFALLKTRD
jgi:hypothetical protein